jgi:hypothetical protein
MKTKEQLAYENGRIDGYYEALKIFIKSYRDVMRTLEKEWKDLRKSHKHDSPPGWNKRKVSA